MSHQATTWVMWFSKSKGADRLVLGAIAHRISNDDGDAWPSILTIQKEANVCERQVYDSIKALTSIGELIIREEKSERGTNRYHMPLFVQWVQSVHPAQNAGARRRKATLHSEQNAPARNADEPSLEPSQNQPSSVVADLSNISPELIQSRERERIAREKRDLKAASKGKKPYPFPRRESVTNVQTEPKRNRGEEARARRAEAFEILKRAGPPSR